ncbi:MAG: CoA pyrophosphatase [Xanthomonadales bacterium]|nr:CoA pyrophosphatase [Xanthomonadales bacterium]
MPTTGDPHYWRDLAGRLLPLDAVPTPDPANLDLLTRYWGGRRPLAQAAVLVPLIARHNGLSVLLTRRNDQLRLHGGQISFPGGRIDPGDADAVQAALRETQEEVGVPAHRVAPLGRLAAMATISQFVVEPVVARLAPDYELRLDPREVSSAFELPLARVAELALWRAYQPVSPVPGLELQALDYQGHTIWGVTAMILQELAARMHGMDL